MLLDELKAFAEELKNYRDHLRIEIQEFPSGSIWLSVYGLGYQLRGKDVEMEYRPDEGYIVSLVDAAYMEPSQTEQFDQFEDAKNEILFLIQKYD